MGEISTIISEDDVIEGDGEVQDVLEVEEMCWLQQVCVWQRRGRGVDEASVGVEDLSGGPRSK